MKGGGGGGRGSTRAKIYYDARGREITEEEKRGKRESRRTEGKRQSERVRGLERENGRGE